ncbi:hypothetical protein DN069_03625 [Streptacidiphilus pinicola]|uniref:Secreted protein n=1 Tax=Streptacidiphilus pinicola TaxID=2219663 RepID=A0A2X0KDC2_9ACTN|nr:hypothetical protein [Streptacidiphilus pinicola]RAG87055.1 hypothetical protein DN069_03625 [Streptacidiphilus pinicola]
MPSRLRWFTTGCLLLTTVLGAVGLTTAVGAQSAWSTIGDQQAPQVVDAAGLYQALTDLDGQSANLIMFGADGSLAGQRTAALSAYTADRTTADRDLQRATLDAAGNANVQHALQDVLDGMGRYQDLDGRALALNDAAHRPAGHPDPSAVADYRQATDLMRTTLLPAADRLVQANNDAYNHTYDTERSVLGTALWWTVALGVALLAALIGLQIWLAGRFRRLVNPALAAATLLVVVFTGLAGSMWADEREHLRYARRDAFDSVVALSRARAVAYDANADESRYLLDPGRAAQYQDAFETESQQILTLSGASISSYDTALAAAVTAYRADHADVRFGGFYGTEFHNITFTGERAAAEQTLAAYQVYERDDRTIRALADSGKLDQAIAFGTSYAPGASNAAFAEHDSALQKLIGINSSAYDQGVKDGRGELSSRIPLLIAAIGLALLLCLVGVRPRLAEFRG